MAKIRVWKMIALYLITLGVYGFVWLAKRRNEIVRHYKLAVPHWLWIVLPIAIACAATVAVSFALVLMMPLEQALYGIAALAGSLFLAVFGISIWWMVRFGRAAEQITQGKVPVLWTVLYWIFLGAVALYMLQYFFNRAPNKSIHHNNAQQRPTKRFVVWSIVAFALVTAVSVADVVYTLNTPGFLGVDIERAKEIDAIGKKAEELNTQYLACIEQLNLKYPELTEAQEADYNKGYDACEKVRLEQNKAVEEHVKALEQW